MRRLKIGVAAVALATTGVLIGAAPAHAIKSAGCTDHNKQATLYSGGAGAGICFQGTGTWTGYIPNVVALWSGPYRVCIGQKGTENPICAKPFTKKSFNAVDIEFVELS